MASAPGRTTMSPSTETVLVQDEMGAQPMQPTTRNPNRSIIGIVPEWVTATAIAFAVLMVNLVLLVKMAL